MTNHPRIFCVACVIAFWITGLCGSALRKRFHSNKKSDDESLTLVVSATLTLLGLIIGFTFSMASTRYDQRRLYEEQEANAIGTEYVRADLLPPAQTAATKALLLDYLKTRIRFYNDTYGPDLVALGTHTNLVQGELWQAIRPDAAAAPTPVTALVVSGMNDVLNSQGYTQFAWWNRIPTSAWWFMVSIALAANLLLGYATTRSRAGYILLLVMPVLVSVSFLLIADIDSPRGGIIRIHPVDLIALSDSLNSPRP